jgi:hypothetical protein
MNFFVIARINRRRTQKYGAALVESDGRRCYRPVGEPDGCATNRIKLLTAQAFQLTVSPFYADWYGSLAVNAQLWKEGLLRFMQTSKGRFS